MMRPTTAHGRRRERPPRDPNKKRRKGLWSFCGPTLYTCGVVCCMWMPKLFLIIGCILSFIGALFLILSSQPSLGFHKTTSGAVAFGFGMVFVIVATIGVFVRKTLKNMPDVEDEYKKTFGPGAKYAADEEDPAGGEAETEFAAIPTVSGRPQSVVPIANGHVAQGSTRQPNSNKNIRPSSASAVDPRTERVKSAGTRPSSSPGRRGISPTPGKNASPQHDRNPLDSSQGLKPNNKTVNKSTKTKADPTRTNYLATKPITEENEELDDKPAFYTGASGQLTDSPSQINTAVLVHPLPKKQPLPPITVISSSSFANDGYEGEEIEPQAGAAVPGLHPNMMETPEELVARSSPRPSPMMMHRKVNPIRRSSSCDEKDARDNVSLSSF